MPLHEQSGETTDSIEETKVETIVIVDDVPQAQETTVIPKYQDNLIRTKEEINRLITHVEGNSLLCNWYNNQIGKDQSPEGYVFEPDVSNVHRQYCLIKDLEIKLQGSLSHSHDTETNQSEVTGTALSYARFTPLVGDPLIFDIGNGQQGLFEVTRSTRKTWHKQSVYEVDIKLKYYVTPEIAEDLDSFVVKRTVFVKEQHTGPNNGIFTTEHYDRYQQAKSLLRDYVRAYRDSFLDNTHDTLIRPDGNYDDYLVSFLNKVGLGPANESMKLSRYVIDFDGKEEPTALDLLLGQRVVDSHLMKAYKLNFSLNLTDNPAFRSIAWSGIEKYVYPKPYVSEQLVDAPDELPLYHEISEDNYIFSKRFYQERKPDSLLERLVLNIINKEPVNLEDVLKVADWDSVFNLPLDKQFYFIPLILLTLHASLRV